MKGIKHTGNGGHRLLVTTVALAALVLSTTIGVAYFMGMLSGKQTAEGIPPALTVSSDRLDFGTVLVHDAVVRQLIVRNDGEEPLRARFSATGSSYSVEPRQMILHPGISSRISVSLLAETAGSLSDELHIEVDERDAAPLVIALDGQASSTPDETMPALMEPERLQASSTDEKTTPRDPTRKSARRTARRSAVSVVAADPAAAPIRIASATTPQRTTTAKPSSKSSSGSKGESRKRTSSDSSANRDRGRDRDSGGRGDVRRTGHSIQVVTGDPSVPFRGVSDTTAPAQGGLGSDQGARPGEIPSKIPDAGADGLPDSPPDDLTDDDMFDDDIFDDDDDDDRNDDPLAGPAFKISGVSTIRLLGSTATFYPQEIGVAGTDLGGPLSLTENVQFPTISFAFGESMLFSQLQPIAGGFDPASGELTLQARIQVVDSDGDAAPVELQLTTGTVVDRNEAGIVVQMSGSPRVPNTGLVRLVGIEKIPVGYGNGAEERLVIFEILGSLNFNPNIQPTRSSFGRIGG